MFIYAIFVINLKFDAPFRLIQLSSARQRGKRRRRQLSKPVELEQTGAVGEAEADADKQIPSGAKLLDIDAVAEEHGHRPRHNKLQEGRPEPVRAGPKQDQQDVAASED